MGTAVIWAWPCFVPYIISLSNRSSPNGRWSGNGTLNKQPNTLTTLSEARESPEASSTQSILSNTALSYFPTIIFCDSPSSRPSLSHINKTSREQPSKTSASFRLHAYAQGERPRSRFPMQPLRFTARTALRGGRAPLANGVRMPPPRKSIAAVTAAPFSTSRTRPAKNQIFAS